jgi:hypothetical protein
LVGNSHPPPAANPFPPPPANPYAPPEATVDDVVAGVDSVVRIRQEHLLHEIRLKSVGTLYWLGTLMFGISGIAMLTSGDASRPGSVVGVGAAMSVLAVTLAVLGYGYRGLRPWLVVPGATVAILGLLAFPLGTLINAYVLYLLFCAKGRTVLAKDYAAVMAATPTLKYRRTVADWVALGIVGALLLSLVLLIAFG